MISFKYSSIEPAATITHASIGGEYTEWLDVRKMSFPDIRALIERRVGPGVDSGEIAREGMDAGFIGIHHSGWGYIAKAWADAK